MTAKDRLLEFLQHLGIGQNAFEKKVGISNGYIAHSKGSFGAAKIAKITATYPQLNPVWLLTGTGEMLKSDTPITTGTQQGAQLIPLLPLAAQGGSLNDFIVSVKADDCEKIVSPIKGVDFAMTVSGNSMEPEYPSGSKILLKKINEKAFIEWGRVYVLDTCNGSVIKKVMPGAANSVTCESLNPTFPPFEVDFSNIYGVYRVLMILSEK